jgi:SAM-dependent methyltransferase
MAVAAPYPALQRPTCRFCGAALAHGLIDLGVQPSANAYLRREDLCRGELFLPLHARVCDRCFLVQIEPQRTPEQLFADYAYFSSYSTSWLKHAEDYCAQMIARFGLGPKHLAIEVASNDGYLLQYFKRGGLNVLGIEPAANVARTAIHKGIPTLVRFFGRETARALVRDGSGADVLVGNNVLAHVPDLNDFVAGLKIALKPTGVLTIEFPHLLRLIEETQFDTVYHEHFSYFSFMTAESVFAAHGIRLFDVEELPTHGGSLRIFGCHADAAHATTPAVERLREAERDAGLRRIDTYRAFTARAEAVKRRLLAFLIEAKDAGKRIAGYGAPAKGNTMLNYCGVRTDLIDYTVDRNPHKQGLYLPGTHIPIHHPDKIRETRPDYVLILPWNLKAEIMADMACIRDWGGQFVTAVPTLEVHA